MFLPFFYHLKQEKFPVSLQEYLTLLEAMQQHLDNYNLDDFYYLSRSILVKHETHLDRYDQIFGHYFNDLELKAQELFGANINEEWLKNKLMSELSEEEKAMIAKMGGLDALMDRFKDLLDEQKDRHEGGNKWIGTGGTSPFGNSGYNPEGFRIGGKGGNRRAVKVWEKRQFANLDDSLELDTRNIKLALKRLRVFTREGQPDELDLDGTIKKTSENAGVLDIKMVPQKKNNVKVLLLMDVGGSMDDHVEMCSRLFSAARHEFKHLEHYYFHNCLYESVWKDNRLRFSERIPTMELLNRYNRDYKVIFVGDAAMAPYEIAYTGGSVEHYNDESGAAWLQRIIDHFDHVSWINPNPIRAWEYYESTYMLRHIFHNRMFPMTLKGISLAMKSLRDKKVQYTLPSEQ